VDHPGLCLERGPGQADDNHNRTAQRSGDLESTSSSSSSSSNLQPSTRTPPRRGHRSLFALCARHSCSKRTRLLSARMSQHARNQSMCVGLQQHPMCFQPISRLVTVAVLSAITQRSQHRASWAPDAGKAQCMLHVHHRLWTVYSFKRRCITPSVRKYFRRCVLYTSTYLTPFHCFACGSRHKALCRPLGLQMQVRLTSCPVDMTGL
jgi:hypothetical protein